MDTYNIIKSKINEKLIFKLSQIGYALGCDILFTTRIPSIIQDVELVNNLKTGNKIFISVISNELTINLHRLLEILKNNNVKVYFYLMYEPIIPYQIIELLYPVALGFFINNNVYDDKLIHNMPIGIRDCGNVVSNHKGFSHNSLFEEKLNKVIKEYMCLMVFSYTHNERYRCYGELKDKSFVINLNDRQYDTRQSTLYGKVPIKINYEYTHKSIYTLSPRGAGEDCHRFYEAIYLDSIPIVKRTNTVFDKLYNMFPCLIVNDWNEVTQELLIEKKEECLQKLIYFKNKYPNFFTSLDNHNEILENI
jgi:hypothetical protein